MLGESHMPHIRTKLKLNTSRTHAHTENRARARTHTWTHGPRSKNKCVAEKWSNDRDRALASIIGKYLSMYSQSMYGTDLQPQQCVCFCFATTHRTSLVRPHATHVRWLLLTSYFEYKCAVQAKFERWDQIIMWYSRVSECCWRQTAKTVVRVCVTLVACCGPSTHTLIGLLFYC